MTEVHVLLAVVVAQAGLLGAAGGGIIAHWDGKSAAKTTGRAFAAGTATITVVLVCLGAFGLLVK